MCHDDSDFQLLVVNVCRHGTCFVNRSARARAWEEKAETQAPFACLDPECSLFFNVMSFLRGHIKTEHLSKWSPQHSFVRDNIVDVEISREMSHFAVLKTLTENVVPKESATSSFFWRAAAWRENDQWKEAEARQEQRTTTRRWAEKHRGGGGGTHRAVHDGVTDLISEVQPKLE